MSLVSLVSLMSLFPVCSVCSVSTDRRVDLIFFKAKSTLRNAKFGPLELTGDGCDMVRGTADDGVCLWVELGASPLRAIFSNFSAHADGERRGPASI